MGTLARLDSNDGQEWPSSGYVLSFRSPYEGHTPLSGRQILIEMFVIGSVYPFHRKIVQLDGRTLLQEVDGQQ